MNTADSDYFFQSDQDLASQERRAKRVNHTRGSAIDVKGKIIALAVSPSGNDVFLASAGHVVLRLDLQVSPPLSALSSPLDPHQFPFFPSLD